MSARSTRRDFVRRIATLIAATPFSGVLAACSDLPPPTEDEVEAGRVAASYYDDVASIAWLGRVYLGDVEGALDASEQLAEALNEAPDDAAALADLEARIAGDFASLRIQVLRGWTLGQTELAACALVARTMA